MVQTSKKNSLGAEDWIKAAFRALWRAGPQAIRVEAIARELGVSKGSFYWHFKDAPALKQAMLDHWAGVATFDAIIKIEQGPKKPHGQLVALIAFATEGQSAEYGGPKVEAAIRDWARFDTAVSVVVNEIEAARLGFVAGLFQKSGFAWHESRQKARLLYGAMIGLEQLPQAESARIRQDMHQLLEHLLSEAGQES